MANDDLKWLVLVVKDKYSNDDEREMLKSLLMRNFSLKKEDVYYVPTDSNFAFSNFVFVREYNPEDDLRKMLECRRDMFEPYPSHMRITDDEFRNMVSGMKEKSKGISIKYGDIVGIKNGVYSKLNGIVLRESKPPKVDVGLKFCFGVVIEQYNPEDLVVKGNIFNYLKVLK